MRHLILLANPNPQSFTHAIADQIGRVVRDLGHEALLRDLYSEEFRPVLSLEDLRGFFRGELPADVAAAQADIREADVVHFVYPLWWTGLPAILKGYVDRVFTPGFAYRRGPNGVEGLLGGKQGMLWTPHGNTEAEYDANGMYDALRKTSDDGILRYAGIDVRAHVFLPDIRATTEAERTAWLQGIEDTIHRHLALPVAR